MKKGDFVDLLARNADISKAEAEKSVVQVFHALEDAIQIDTKVSIPPFGIFQVVERPARQGRNPKTGESIEIAARRTIKFKPSKSLQEVIHV